MAVLDDILKGAQLGRMLGDPVARGITAGITRRQDLEDQERRRQLILENAELSRKQQLEDFGRREQSSINQILLNNPDLLQGMAGEQTQPQNVISIGGRNFDASGVLKAREEQARREALLKRLANPPQPSVVGGMLQSPQVDERGVVTGINVSDVPVNVNVPEQDLNAMTLEETDALNMEGMTGTSPEAAQATKQTTLRDLERERRLEEIGAKRTSLSSRPATQGQIMSALTNASKYGVNPEAFRDQAGEIDYQRLSVAIGAAQKQNRDAERKAKLEAIPAEMRTKAAGYIAVQKDLDDLKEDVESLQKSGRIPSLLDNAISSATSGAPDGFFSSLYRAGLQNFQSAESREFEGTKARVATALSNMISGAAIPESERKFLTPFTPVQGETFESLVGKLSGLERYLQNRISTFSQPVSGGGKPSSSGGEPFKIGRFTVEVE